MPSGEEKNSQVRNEAHNSMLLGLYAGRGQILRQDNGLRKRRLRTAPERNSCAWRDTEPVTPNSFSVLSRPALATGLQGGAKWFRIAAEQGYAGAQYHLGSMYEDGQRVPNEYTEAVELHHLRHSEVTRRLSTISASCTKSAKAFPRTTSRRICRFLAVQHRHAALTGAESES